MCQPADSPRESLTLHLSLSSSSLLSSARGTLASRARFQRAMSPASMAVQKSFHRTPLAGGCGGERFQLRTMYFIQAGFAHANLLKPASVEGAKCEGRLSLGPPFFAGSMRVKDVCFSPLFPCLRKQRKIVPSSDEPLGCVDARVEAAVCPRAVVACVVNARRDDQVQRKRRRISKAQRKPQYELPPTRSCRRS